LSRCCIVVALALTAAGCTSRPDPTPIWLGHVANLSGPERQAGEAASRGIRLAVEDINKDVEQGLGRPIKVIHSDARGKLEAFEAEAVRLVSINRASFLLGGATLEEADRLDRAGVPVLAPIGVSGRTKSESIYFTGLAASQQGRVLAQFAALELGATSIAVVGDERRDDFVETAEAFAREFPASWGKKDVQTAAVVRRLRWTSDTKPAEMAQMLQKQITDGGCKAVVFAGRVEDLRDLGPLPVPVLFAESKARRLHWRSCAGLARKSIS